MGVIQTDPKHAGEIFLVARTPAPINDPSKQVLNRSHGFSVAAIPIGVKMSDPIKQEGTEISARQGANYRFAFGYVYKVTYISDSGSPADLDQVKISEVVTPKDNPMNAAKILGPETKTSGFKPAIPPGGQLFYGDALRYKIFVLRDNNTPDLAHAKAVAYVRSSIGKFGTGSTTDTQFFKFVDNRTGSTDEKTAFIIRASGFESVYDFQKDGDIYYLYITKNGAAINASGVLSGEIILNDSQPKKLEIK